MKRLLVALTAAFLLAPAAALADNPPSTTARQTAEQQCRAQRTSLGVTAFNALYGTNANKADAFGKCVAKLSRQNEQAEESAAAACKKEQAADPAAFAKKYGTNRNGKNALGNCISQQAKATEQAQQQATINAAKTCSTERKSLGDAAFKAKYGTNANKSNAFGRCVSQHAKTP
jgi:hypothetical protein